MSDTNDPWVSRIGELPVKEVDPAPETKPDYASLYTSRIAKRLEMLAKEYQLDWLDAGRARELFIAVVEKCQSPEKAMTAINFGLFSDSEWLHVALERMGGIESKLAAHWIDYATGYGKPYQNHKRRSVPVTREWHSQFDKMERTHDKLEAEDRQEGNYERYPLR